MSRTSTNELSALGNLLNGYDYKNQAWVKDAEYQDCGHPEKGEVLAAFMGFPEGRIFPGCNCYGREHAGELCTNDGNGVEIPGLALLIKIQTA